MARYSRNNWLRQAHFFNKVPDLLSWFVPVHNRHIAVHQNQVKAAILISIFFNVGFDLLKCLEAIVGSDDQFLIFNANWVFKNHGKSLKVEGLVVHNENLLRLQHLIWDNHFLIYHFFLTNERYIYRIQLMQSLVKSLLYLNFRKVVLVTKFPLLHIANIVELLSILRPPLKL